MVFGLALIALAGLLGIMLFKGGFQSSCCSCSQNKAANQQTPKTDP